MGGKESKKDWTKDAAGRIAWAEAPKCVIEETADSNGFLEDPKRLTSSKEAERNESGFGGAKAGPEPWLPQRKFG